MTPEERKQKVTWLNRAFHAEKNARAWQAKLERDRSLAERISRSPSEGAGAPQGNSTEDYLIRLAATQEGLQDALRALVDVREEIADAIRQVEDLDEQTILVWHFLDYMPFDKIAEQMLYSRPTVMRKYKRALEKMILNDTPECATMLV